MAQAIKRTTKKTTTKKVETPVAPVVEKVDIETNETTDASVEIKKEKKEFKPTDGIPCASNTSGELFYVGAKSGELYTWADIEYVIDVQYQDLKYAAASRDGMMYKPRFIVLDEDFIKEYPNLEEVYASLYTVQDLKNMLKLSATQLKKAVEALPNTAKENLKTIVVTMIDSGQFDSVQRIKVLDEVFGTEMLLKVTA